MLRVTVILTLLFASACSVDDRCGPDLIFDDTRNGCIPPPANTEADSGVASETDAGTADASATDAGSEPDAGVCASPGYGDPCYTGGETDDCPCTANFCALQPGFTEGFCTHVGCLDSGGECPTGYTCYDLTAIAPEVGSICVPAQ